MINQYVIQKVDSSNPLWWSYDSILKWPEQLPSWTDGLDSRQTSASSTRNAISTNSNQRPMAAKKHRTPVRRSSKEVRKHIDWGRLVSFYIKQQKPHLHGQKLSSSQSGYQSGSWSRWCTRFHFSIQQSASHFCSLFCHCYIAIHLIPGLDLSRSQSVYTGQNILIQIAI